MRAIFCASAMLALSLPCLSQDLLHTDAARQACGPVDTKTVKPELELKKPQTSSPEEGKALVYVFQQYAPRAAPCLGRCGALVRVGLDGRWIGATLGDSYLMTNIAAGDHHLCGNWQGRGDGFNELVALKAAHLEAGKSYYFSVRVLQTETTYTIELLTLDPDEARMLLEAYPQAR